MQEVSWHTARLGDGGTVPVLAAQAAEQLGKQGVWVVAICLSSLVLVLPWTIVFSLQAVGPCVFVIVSVPPGTLQSVHGRGIR